MYLYIVNSILIIQLNTKIFKCGLMKSTLAAVYKRLQQRRCMPFAWWYGVSVPAITLSLNRYSNSPSPAVN